MTHFHKKVWYICKVFKFCLCFICPTQRMQIWGTSRPARFSLHEREACEASRVLFCLRVLAIESIDIVCFDLLLAQRRFNSSRDGSWLSSVCQGFNEERNELKGFGRGEWKHFTITELKEPESVLPSLQKRRLPKLFEWENSWEFVLY